MKSNFAAMQKRSSSQNEKNTTAVLALVLTIFLLAACSSIPSDEIVVVSREDGSGTRGAFIDMLGIEEKDGVGNRTDHTTDEATIANSTSIVMTTVAGNKNAIGYISLGSMNNTVKAVKVDQIHASMENVKDGTYKVYRPFIIATRDDTDDLTQDFISFILSSDGQKVVEETGYIAASDAGPYNGTKPPGKIVVAGSSSVTPVMEKLKEAYIVINTNAEIEVQLGDSTTGILYVIEGTSNIGLSSRDLNESELKSLNSTAIALDGIAIIVNNESQVENLTTEQIRDIFMGDITIWSEIVGQHLPKE